MSSASLTELANSFQSDKGTTFGECHGYTEVYEPFLQARRDESLNLLEIGLRHDPYYDGKDPGCESPSLSMWLEFLPNARIYAIDIRDFQRLSGGRCTVLQGDQGSVRFWNRIVPQLPEMDVIIDDGSHASFHQQLSFQHLIGLLKPTGVYFIEDLHYQPEWESDLPPVPKTAHLLRSPMMKHAYKVQLVCDDKLAVVQKRFS